MAARGARGEAMLEGPAVDRRGRECGALVLGMPGLSARWTSVLALGRRRLGRLDAVGRRGLGGGRGILACRGQLLSQLGDDFLEGVEFRLPRIQSRLEPLTIGAAVCLLGFHGGRLYMPCIWDTTPVNGHPFRKHVQEKATDKLDRLESHRLTYAVTSVV